MVCFICTRLDPSNILVLYCLNFLEIHFFCFKVFHVEYKQEFEENTQKNESIAVQPSSIEADFIVKYQLLLCQYVCRFLPTSVYSHFCLIFLILFLYLFCLFYVTWILQYIYRSMHEHSICFFLICCVMGYVFYRLLQ